MRLEELNMLDAMSAARELRQCCGSGRWATLMAAARPFASAAAMAATSDAVWRSLGREDWLEAFAAHARIGQETRSSWEATEQSGVTGHQCPAFDQLNRDYEARFGYIFIVCATGKSGEAMAALLTARLRNNPDEELRVAAEEQRQITRIRLAKLLT